MRYPIAISRFWQWLFILFGFAPNRAYFDLDADTLHIRFGPTVERIPRAEIAGARRRGWPWFFGLGAKLGPNGGVSYVGSLAGVLQIDFVRPRPLRVWGPFRAARARCVIVSLEQADRFVAAINGERSQAAPAQSQQNTDLRALNDALAGSTNLDELRAAATALGLTYAEQTVFGSQPYRYASLSFAAPVDARAFCEAIGWERPYAVSGDVEQRAWQIRLWASDLSDPHGQRIHTVMPELGPWTVTAHLTGRPAGELPGVSAGASPAYDLARYPATIARLDVRAAADLAR